MNEPATYWMVTICELSEAPDHRFVLRGPSPMALLHDLGIICNLRGITPRVIQIDPIEQPTDFT